MDNFQELVMKLADIKRELKLYKGQETKYINDIKKELDKRGLSKFETDNGIKLSYTESTKSDVDEEKLIKCIYNLVNECKDFDTKAQLLSCIIHKPTVDEDKLQELIYKGLISTDDIESAFTYKTTKTLRLFGGK